MAQFILQFKMLFISTSELILQMKKMPLSSWKSGPAPISQFAYSRSDLFTSCNLLALNSLPHHEALTLAWAALVRILFGLVAVVSRRDTTNDAHC